MRFLCRIGWHDWTFGEPYKEATIWNGGEKDEYEIVKWVQRKTCCCCGRRAIVNV